MSGAPCSLGSSSPAIINPGDDVVLTAPTVAPPAAAEVPLVVTMSSESADVTPSPETASCPPPIRIVVEADGSSVSPRSEEFGASDVAKTLEECAALGEPFVFEGPEKVCTPALLRLRGLVIIVSYNILYYGNMPKFQMPNWERANPGLRFLDCVALR